MPYNVSPDDGDSNSRRPITRIRQACLGCRRKKVRCSGTRPQCFLCRQLDQDCQYSDHGSNRKQRKSRAPALGGSPVISADVSCGTENAGIGTSSHDELALKVSSLEAQLRTLVHTMQRDDRSEIEGRGSSDKLQPNTIKSQNHHCIFEDASLISPQRLLSHVPVEVVFDLYFRYCHNQPYSLFHEGLLRDRYKEGSLPDYLILTISAYALRFSHKALYGERTNEVMTRCAMAAWSKMVILWNSCKDGETDLHMIQSLHLLSIIDFTDGQVRRAWIKIGIVIRQCQDLKLMAEPDPRLPFLEQEERRRVFWSTYILDRIVSCGRQRPTTIRDSECSVKLPCDECLFREDKEAKSPSIGQLSSAETSEASPFALGILAVSILGRCVSVCFNDTQIHNSKGFWGPATEHGAILLSLISFEARFGLREPFLAVLSREYQATGVIDQQRAGHFLFCHIIFHLCYCLLYHPLLVWRQVRSAPTIDQSKLVQASIDSARQHAAALTTILQDAKDAQCNTVGSVYAYAGAVAGSIHTLSEQLSSPLPQFNEERLFHYAVRHLSALTSHWQSAACMLDCLHQIKAQACRYRSALCLNSPKAGSSISDDEIFGLVDYTVLAKTRRLPVPDSSEDNEKGTAAQGNLLGNDHLLTMPPDTPSISALDSSLCNPGMVLNGFEGLFSPWNFDDLLSYEASMPDSYGYSHVHCNEPD